jgi:protein TonB
MSPRRAATIGTVAAIHALAIYALISGMGTTVVTQVEHVLNVDVVDTQIPTKVTPLPLQPNLVKPTDPTVTVPEPKIDVASDQPTNQITVAPTPTNTTPPVNTVASGLTNTHSTPPYPVAARTAGHQGIVTLQITVGPNGDVANATVAQSSGFPELDQAAVEWVTNHWKYKPAVQGGVPVTSTTQAAVKFDLQQARR